ncbi:MAG: hypothetical protein RL885_29100 [Planctomycetota bacterium]
MTAHFQSLRRKLLPFLALVLLAALGTAQNDPDLQAARMAKAMDFAIDDQGAIVMGWAEPASPYDIMHVQRSDDQGRSWVDLYVGPLGRVDEIVHVSLDLAYGTGDPAIDNKVYLGINGIWTDRGQPIGFLGLLSGSYLAPWSQPQCEWIQPAWGQLPPWIGMMSSVAVIPRNGGSDYAVGMAYTFPDKATGTVTVQVVYSTDYGASSQGGRMIAGRYGDSITLAHDFGHPSLVGDANNRQVVLTFHDATDGRIHLLSGDIDSHIEDFKPLDATFQTSSSATYSSPCVAIYRGEINFTALRGTPDRYGARTLTWFNGLTASGFRELLALHGQVLTDADILIRGNDAFVTAVCVTDPVLPRPGMGVLFFQAHVQGFEVTTTQVNDQPIVDPLSPKIAITPRGANAIPAESQLYRTESPRSDAWIDP